MDYLAPVRFLHHGRPLPKLRSAVAALTYSVAVVALACGGGGGPAPPPAPAGVGPPDATVAPSPVPPATPSPASRPDPPGAVTAVATPPTSPGLSPEPVVQPSATPGAVSFEVSWPGGAGTTRGTITLPARTGGGGGLPAVLLVADGGGADRDWVSPSIPGINGSGRLLAAELAAGGFVTLRYDRRGAGRLGATTAPGPGENRLEDSVDEVAAAIEYLASRPEVDAGRIAVLAHDEGGLHAMLREQRATGPRLAGLALLAPSGLSLRQQVLRRLGQLTEGPEDEPLLARFDAAMAFFVLGVEPEGDFGLTTSLQELFDVLSHPLNRPYVSETWNLEPASLLPAVRVPVLVVIGKADVESDWLVDGGTWEEAAADRGDVRFMYPDNADHVLKAVGEAVDAGPATGLATYNAAGRTLDGAVVSELLAWLGELDVATGP